MANAKAVFWYRRLLDMQPKEPLLNYELGIFLKKNENFSEAFGLLEKALRLEGVDVATHLTQVMNSLGINTPYEDDD